MLSSAKIGTASWRYYTAGVACAATEYYLGIGEAPGRWHGRGLPRLGLEPGAVVGEAQLEALFARALHPVSGARLGRAWRTDGVTGFDLTFSAPKSVSSLWALADPNIAGEVRAAHAAAVDAALSYLDTHASWSRRGVNGTQQIASGGLVAALFEHRTSRCADPQLHTHALVVNKVACADGVWRTLDATELYHDKKSAGMIYQAGLRSELSGRLGVVFDAADSNGQAEIIGVLAGLLKLWSKRTAQIEPEAESKIAEYEKSLGRSLTPSERAAVTKTAVLKTRPGKTYHDAGSLRERWVSEAAAAGYDPSGVVRSVREVARQAGRQAPGHAVGAEVAIAAGAVQGAAGERAVFSRADVAGQVAARLPVDGRCAAGIVALVEELTDRALALEDAVPVGRHPQGRTARASDARWAGAEVLAAEARVLSLAERGRSAGYGRSRAAAAIVAFTDAALDRGQWPAAFELATGGDFLSVLTAPAGAGKTRTLGALTKAWQESGYRVIGLAPSARAAAELAAATGGVADTLAKWRVDHDRRGTLLPHQSARTILDGRTVVVVDEASMASTPDLDVLITAAARGAAKVVLVGDPAQIGVVNGPGGMLAALAATGHGHELGTVHRFTEDWEATASLALRTGDPAVLTEYQDHQRLHACPDTEQAINALHGHWVSERAHGREVLMMARTRADVQALNDRARATAIDAGEVQGQMVRIGDRDWQAGDLVRTRRNDRTLPTDAVTNDRARDGATGHGHVRNGDRWRVVAVEESGLRVEHLERGDRVFLPATYVATHAEYGWATTITAAQGATVDVGLVLVRPGIDREHLYVALTRGRTGNHAYITPDSGTDAEHHHGLPPVAGAAACDLEQRAHDVLATALAGTGAQDAAHTARDRAREHAIEHARRAADIAARQAAQPVVPAEHTARAALLTQRKEERAALCQVQRQHDRAAVDARAELARTPRWRRGRRDTLADTISHHQSALNDSFSDAARLDSEIANLTRQVGVDTRLREDDESRRAMRPRRPRTDQVEGYLAPAKTVEWRDAVTSVAVHQAAAARRRTQKLEHVNEHTRGSRHYGQHLSRDDAPGLGL